MTYNVFSGTLNPTQSVGSALVVGWVTVSGFDSWGDTLCLYVASHPGRLSLLPSVGR